MRRDIMKSVLVGCGVGILLVLSSGCADHQAKNKQAATERWQRVQRDMTVEQAEQQFRSGDYMTALNNVNDVLRGEPDYLPGHSLAGRIYLEEGNYKQAIQSFERCLALDEGYDPAYYHLGIIYEKWRRMDEALKAYEEALRLRPDHTAYQVAVAETLVGLDRTDEAMARMQDELDAYGPEPALLELMGRVSVCRRDWDAAGDYYQQALRLDDDNVVVKAAWAEVLVQQNEPVTALQMMDEIEVTLHDEGYAMPWHYGYTQGRCLIMTGQWHRAIRLFERLVEERDDSVQAWVSLSQAWLARDNAGQARRCASTALGLDDKAGEALLVLAYLAIDARDYGQASRHLTAVLGGDDENAAAWVLLGYVYACEGKTDKAEETIERALTLSPKNQFALQIQDALVH